MTNGSQTVVFTLSEGDYHYGVAALLNSIVNIGFAGHFVVGYRGVLPPWANKLSINDDKVKLGPTTVHFVKVDPPMHFGFYKPFFACTLRERFPTSDAILYADPDILFLAPWEFFEHWIVINNTVGLCADQNFPSVAESHPWRTDWTRLARESGYAIENAAAPYANSGFVGVSRNHADFWTHWRDITLTYERTGGDVRKFRMNERWRSVVGDQDLMAAALMTYKTSPSLLGGEGMGFNGDFKFLCHVVDQPKPWRSWLSLAALGGKPPSAAVRTWHRHRSGVIESRNAFENRVIWLDKQIALLISRFYRRP